MKNFIVTILLILSAFTSYAEPQEWYKLEDDELYVTDFLLSAQQNKKINIDSAHPAKIGFKTDVAFAPNSFELYKELSKKYKYKVIKFIDSDKGNSLSTVSGASMECVPINDKISVEIVNLTDQDFKILIYKKK